MINATTAPQSRLDEQKATPGVWSMLGASLDAGISRTTMGSSEQVRQVLLDEFAAEARSLRAQGEDGLADNLTKFAEHTHLITVDFDAIPNADCRQAYHSIATSWTLPKRQINGLLVMGKALLANDPGFVPVLQDAGGTLTNPLPSVTAACKLVGQ
jgi:hypothetical protein